MTERERARDFDGAAGTGAKQAMSWLLAARREDRQGLRRYIGPKRVAAVVALTALIFGAWYLRTRGIFDPGLIERFIRLYPVAAPAAMIAIYAAAVVSGLPTLPLNLAAGVFWGPVLGGLISTVAATAGAIVAFAAARTIFGRPLAVRFDNKLIAQFQREFEEKGWRFIAFVRLNPVFPTGPLNYLLGLTAVDAFTYAWPTFVFLLAPSVAVAFIGHSVGTFVVTGEIADSLKMILAISAAVTVLAAFAYGARLAAKGRNAEPR